MKSKYKNTFKQEPILETEDVLEQALIKADTMNQEEKSFEEFLRFIKDCDPAKVAETLKAKGIAVDKLNFVYQMTMLKAELTIAKSVGFLNKTREQSQVIGYKTREQSLVAEYLSDVIEKSETPNVKTKSRDFVVAELEISYKRKKKNSLIINCANIAYQVFREMWDESLLSIQEQIGALYLNFAGAVIGYRLLSTGTVKSCQVDANLMVSFALLSRATGVILAHNHPSGTLQYSDADKNMTVAAQKMLNQFDITLLDHLIVTEDNYFSMKDNRVIAFN